MQHFLVFIVILAVGGIGGATGYLIGTLWNWIGARWETTHTHAELSEKPFYEPTDGNPISGHQQHTT